MKSILLILVICIHSYAADDHKSADRSPDIAEILQRKCENNAGNTEAFPKLKDALDGLPFCIFYLDLPEPLHHHDDFCKKLRESAVYECVSNCTEAIRPCLDETEAYLPELMLTMLNTTYNELCGVNGFSNIEYLFKIFESIDPAVNTCLRTTSHMLTKEETFANTTVFKNLYENSVINLNAKDVCSDLKSLQKYFSQLMKHECNEDYSRFVDLYSQPFLEECNILHT